MRPDEPDVDYSLNNGHLACILVCVTIELTEKPFGHPLVKTACRFLGWRRTMHILKTPRHLWDVHMARMRQKIEVAKSREPEKVTDLENQLLYQEAIFFTRHAGELVTLGDIPNPRAHIQPSAQV